MYEMTRTVERMRDAACLAHAIPGVTLRLRSGERELLVSAACLAASLDPCRFRSLVATGAIGQLSPLTPFDEVEIAGGVVHVGGGLFQPSHPGSTDDRWFVSTLGHDHLVALLSACPLDASEAFSVVIKPDPELGRSAVRVRCDVRAAACHLDEVAMWAMSTCLIEELTGEPSAAPSTSPRDR